jgi:thymidylate synthase
MKLPPAILISETDFHNAWARAVRNVLRDGKRMTIGDSSEPKPIRDACVLFELTGNAIKQIESHELHPQFPFRHIDQYCEEFTYGFQRKYMNLDDATSEFSYTYFDRLVNYTSRLSTQSNINQLISLREHLRLEIKRSISSNRNQAITWKPYNDIENSAAPCLQRIWIRYLGDQSVEVHLTWRSRDLYTAWQANIVAIIDMLNREVIRPNNCRIVRLIDYADSLHIYESDKDAEQVKPLPVSPHK